MLNADLYSLLDFISCQSFTAYTLHKIMSSHYKLMGLSFYISSGITFNHHKPPRKLGGMSGARKILRGTKLHRFIN